jgi:hypothetical protein
MPYLPGSSCAEALIRVGLPREAVVRALVIELDLTDSEADTAWQSVTSRHQDDVAAIRRAVRTVTAASAR